MGASGTTGASKRSFKTEFFHYTKYLTIGVWSIGVIVIVIVSVIVV